MKKKLLSLLAFALVSVSSALAYDTYTLTLNGSAAVTPEGSNFFTVVTGGGFNTKYTGTYDGVTYTKGLKVNSKSSITFTTSAKSDITIVQSTAANGAKKFKLGGVSINHEATASVEINGVAVSYAMTENTENTYKEFVFTDVPATSGLAITQDGETGLLFVKVAYKEAAMTSLDAPKITFESATGLVTISAVENATKVTYTTDGTSPSASSETYIAPFVVADGTTVKAVAIGDAVSYANSEVVSQLVTLTGITMATPTFNSYNGTVAIATTSPQATIKYSIDGGKTYTDYARAFTLSENAEVKAYATRTGCTDSEVSSVVVNSVIGKGEATKTIWMGLGSFDSDNANKITGKKGDDAEGIVLQITGNLEKNYTSGNSKISIGGIERTAIKLSNGAQNTMTLPDGMKATRMTIYSFINDSKASGYKCYWREFNGKNITGDDVVPMGAYNDVEDRLTNPDARVFELDGETKEITFTNSGTQVCFVIALDVVVPITTTIAESGVSSFANDNAIDCANLPEGLTAWQVTGTAEGKATLTQVKEAVEAGTGLILQGEAGKNYTLPVVASGSKLADNKLVGVTIAKTLTADAAYVLSAGKFVKAKEGTLAAGKAYLPIAAGSAPELQLSFGSEATGIKAIANSVAVNSSIFNLSGQRVAQPTKGLYIVNGKKVVMK